MLSQAFTRDIMKLKSIFVPPNPIMRDLFLFLSKKAISLNLIFYDENVETFILEKLGAQGFSKE